MAGLFIGTSGWNYKHWKEAFYPRDVPQSGWLQYYSRHFNTAEVNYSFYKLPSPSTYQKWCEQVPSDFVFSLKCSRLITHAKRLGNLGDLWENFTDNALSLGNHRGPILCQFPDRFEKDIARLENFLCSANRAMPDRCRLRLAAEFRHESWFSADVYRLLEKYNVALVTASSSLYPRADVITSDFAYFRYHGPGALFASKYNVREINREARNIEKLLSVGLDVYAYFNNDGFAFATENASQLKQKLSFEKGVKVS